MLLTGISLRREVSVGDVQKLAELLGTWFGPGELRCDEPMSEHTTFACGGPADLFVTPSDVEGVGHAVEAAISTGVPWRVMGQGSNLLVADSGVRGLVVCIGEPLSQITVDGTRIRAGAGATNAVVAEAACAAGLAGYEFASGIPGSIGGAAIMNAGAYDGEFKDVATGVRCLVPGQGLRDVSAEEAAWGYRHSMMSDRGHIVLEVTLQLRRDDPAAIRGRIDDLTARRESRQPLEMASAGSTFKRPEGHYAGKLIEEAGMRGHTVGRAQVSEKHCGFVVNTGGATSVEVLQVIHDVQEAVHDRSGVMLEPEVRMWGFD